MPIRTSDDLYDIARELERDMIREAHACDDLADQYRYEDVNVEYTAQAHAWRQAARMVKRAFS